MLYIYNKYYNDFTDFSMISMVDAKNMLCICIYCKIQEEHQQCGL